MEKMFLEYKGSSLKSFCLCTEYHLLVKLTSYVDLKLLVWTEEYIRAHANSVASRVRQDEIFDDDVHFVVRFVVSNSVSATLH